MPYRWRTALRRALPHRPALWRLVPKGRDCGPGRHEWYRRDALTRACHHCRAVRPGGPA